MKKKSIISIILFLSVAWTVFADDKGLLDIKDIPSHNSTGELTGIGEYTDKGTINKIYKDRIVINDLNFYLDTGIKMFKSSGRKYSGTLKENDFIYYFLNKDKKIFKIVIKSQ